MLSNLLLKTFLEKECWSLTTWEKFNAGGYLFSVQLQNAELNLHYRDLLYDKQHALGKRTKHFIVMDGPLKTGPII